MATNDEISSLNEAFRSYALNLPDSVRELFINTLQDAFQVKNRRNVLLWISEGSQRRNFINRNGGPSEYKMRKAFAEAVLQTQPPVGPQKSTEVLAWRRSTGGVLRRYLSEEYTRMAITSIGFGSDSMDILYESYGAVRENEDDIETDEFEDLFDQ